MVKVGRETYLQFAPPDDRNSPHRRSLLPKLAHSTSTGGGSGGNGESKGESTTASEVSSRRGNEEVASLSSLTHLVPGQAMNTRARGEIWMRQSLSKGGHLECCYGVLETGKFDVYASEEVRDTHQHIPSLTLALAWLGLQRQSEPHHQEPFPTLEISP
jgi:hypothetical protein